MRFTYSKEIKHTVGSSRVSSKRVLDGDTIDKGIQIYRMWFLFLRLGLDCEDNNIKLLDFHKQKEVKVKVNKRYYRQWDIDRVKHDTFNSWWKDKKHLFHEVPSQFVTKIEDNENYLYLQIDKRQTKQRLINDITRLYRGQKTQPLSKFNTNNQHKYVSLMMKYNIFIWREMGITRRQMIEKIKSVYKFYEIRKPETDRSITRLISNSQKIVINTSKGEF